MKTRILIGAILIAIIVGLFALDEFTGTRAAISGLIVILGTVGWLEMALMGRVGSRDSGGGPALLAVGLAATLWFLGVAWWECARGESSPLLISAGFAALAFGGSLAVFGREDFADALRQLAFTILAALLFGFLFSHVLRIYHRPQGLVVGLFFVLGVKGNDISAYFCGRAIGRHRFLKVSPKKTLEGSAAAVLFSVVWFVSGGEIWPELFFDWPVSIALGIIFSVTTQVGDLAESLVKRACGVKDSAALLPEYGGVLDLIDSTLFSGWLLWAVLAIRG